MIALLIANIPNIPSMAAMVCATALALNDKPGWGWMMLIASLASVGRVVSK